MDKDQIDALLAKYLSWQSEIWLNIPESFEDIKVLNMNLKHLLMLDGLESPFLKGGKITDTDAYLFLWVVSEDFTYNKKDRDKFFKQLNKFDTYSICKWIEEYVKKAFAESDTMTTKTKSQTYFIAYFVDCFAREYGWRIDEIMQIPLGIAFQLITTINERNYAQGGKEYNRVTDLDNTINRWILKGNSDNGIL